MAHVVVMYKTPKDTAAFDKYYFETHVPIAFLAAEPHDIPIEEVHLAEGKDRSSAAIGV